MLDRKVKGLGLPILYLDFDGVLHPEYCYWHPRKGPYLKAPGHSLFEHLALLESLLEPHPEVRIVLSTTWVQACQFSGTARKLGSTLRPRVIGATFHTGMDKDGFRDMPRGLQVMGDVARRLPSTWIALDDDPKGLASRCPGQTGPDPRAPWPWRGSSSGGIEGQASDVGFKKYFLSTFYDESRPQIAGIGHERPPHHRI